MNKLAETGSRRSRRILIALEGSILGVQSRQVRLQDLSVTGCLVQCAVNIGHGTILDLRVRLGSDDLATKARVVGAFVDGASLPGPPQYLVGLEFVGMAAAEEARLRGFIDQERRRADG